jgi:hypothetical protein
LSHPAFDLGALTASVADVAGPFVLALAGLGLFVTAWRAGSRQCLAAAVIAVMVFFVAQRSPMSPLVVLAPIMAGLWWLAAVGANDLVGFAGAGPLSRVVSIVVLMLLPALQLGRLERDERDDWVRPRGHERATLREVTAVLNVVASDAGFVEEDATIDILLRAAVFGGRRASKPFIVLPPQRNVIEQAMNVRYVYAFPHRQEDLIERGFVVEPVMVTLRRSDRDLTTVDGVAQLKAVRPCRNVERTWVEVGGVSRGGRIAMAADSESDRGPIIAYLGGATPVDPRPDGWPPRTTRGFRFAVFDQRDKVLSERLQAEARQAGLSSEHPVMTSPFVVRLTLHRTPRAPSALAVDLGASFPVGVAKLAEDNADAAGHLTLCDAPAVHVVPFGSRQP